MPQPRTAAKITDDGLDNVMFAHFKVFLANKYYRSMFRLHQSLVDLEGKLSEGDKYKGAFLWQVGNGVFAT